MVLKKLPILGKRYRMQILVALTCNFMYFSHGLGVGWISPILQILQSPETPLNFPVSVEQVSWIGSMFGIGFFSGNIVFGLIVNRLSHKWNMYLLALPHMLYWILNYFVHNVAYLYAGRFFAGITSGGIFVIFPIFLSEILDKEIRGAIMSMGMFLLSAGILTGFILPTNVDYYLTPCIAMFFPIMYIILLCFFPETPQSLIKRNSFEEAEISFNFYKGIESRVQPTSSVIQPKATTENLTEFEELKAIILHSHSNRTLNMKDFVSPSSLKAFANAFVLCILYQLSGSFAFFTYMNSIFAASGSTMDPNLSTIIVGVLHIFGTFFATVFVERLGRRALLFSSVAGMTLGMIGFGAFAQFADAGTKTQFNWAPLAFMIVVVFASAYGLFGNFFTIVVEVLPAKIRSQALSLTMCFVSILVFVILKIYPYFLFELGITATMYSSASVCVITGNFMYFSHGLGVGWISPILQILQSPETPLNFPVSVEQVSWIGSMFGIGFFSGNIVFGLIVNRLSHKWNMYLLALPHMLYWILNYFVHNVAYLYAGRFFAGITSGGIFVIFPIFLSEILDKEIRGAIMSMGMFLLSAGILTGFILPTNVDYYLTPCIAMFFPIMYIILLCFFPETPQSLIKRNSFEEAEISFNFYKGIESRVQPTSSVIQPKATTENLTEFEELKAIILHSHSNRTLNMKDFVSPSSLKAFANAFVLCILYQLSGSFAFFTYMNSIFAASGSTMDPNLSTIIVGVLHIFGTFFATVFVERLGRRALLFSSVAGMTLGMIGFGAFAQFADAGTKTQFNWAPLAFMIVVVFASAYGLFGNFFTIVVEVLPAKIRSQALSLTMCFVSILVFVILKIYPYFLFELGITATMYSSASVCVITGIYLYIFLPETKRKSMEKD